MTYQKQNWVNFPSTATPISASRLSHLETQYDEGVKYTDSQLSGKADLDSGGKIPTGQLPTSTSPAPGTIPIRSAGGTIPGVGTPINSADAANKSYVDSVAGGGSGGNRAHQEIYELAIRDGWQALYDPSNTQSLTYSGETVSGISDSLQKSPALTADTYNSATVKTNRFGELSALSGAMLSASGFSLTTPASVMAVSSFRFEGASKYLIGGNSSTSRGTLSVFTNRAVAIGNGSTTRATDTVTDGDHILDATFNGALSVANGNSQLYHRGLPDGIVTSIQSFRVGGLTAASESLKWPGDVGPVLIHANPTDAILNRMRNLLHDLTGIEADSPRFTSDVQVFSSDTWGESRLAKGSPDIISGDFIMSLTKMINALTARQILTTDANLNETVTVLAGDALNSPGSDPTFNTGDVVTYRDLIKAMAIPSNNLAPRAVARAVAERSIPGSNPAISRFLGRMNQYVTGSLGLTDASVFAVGGGGRLSPRQVSVILNEVSKDPVLAEIFGTLNTTISVTGPNARSITLNSTLNAAPYGIPELVLGKTGTGGGSGGTLHVAVRWRDEQNRVHNTSCIMMNRTTNRYLNLYRAIQAIKNGQFNMDYAETPRSIQSARSTSTLDVTGIFPGTTRTSRDKSGVHLVRMGDMMTLSFYGVVLDRALFSMVLPYQYRPEIDIFGTVFRVGTGFSTSIRVSSAGTVEFYGAPTEEIRGSITYPAAAGRGFPDYPTWPGYPLEEDSSE